MFYCTESFLLLKDFILLDKGQQWKIQEIIELTFMFTKL